MALILFISGCSNGTWFPDGGTPHVKFSSDLDFSPSEKKHKYDYSDDDVDTQPTEEVER